MKKIVLSLGLTSILFIQPSFAEDRAKETNAREEIPESELNHVVQSVKDMVFYAKKIKCDEDSTDDYKEHLINSVFLLEYLNTTFAGTRSRSEQPNIVLDTSSTNESTSVTWLRRIKVYMTPDLLSITRTQMVVFNLIRSPFDKPGSKPRWVPTGEVWNCKILN